ncbi:hypothetical protein K4M05_14225 [Pseudomonas syringae pv. tomato]|nr:hypothetical protein [Pseudomonas syringae]MBX6509501.1 hypothetical protein [Pseudomonas syringae pv. tomato]TES59012.1 hypothetical protein E2N91_11530 [Pseudomonas syringae pv. tomato]TES70853.1 hypothetical protein E2N89_32085 [Pseudomonas syringae pv. tomato]
MKVTLAVKANGGSVTVQILAGDNWITTDTLWKDGGYQLSFPPATIRIVPAAGAAFEVYA